MYIFTYRLAFHINHTHNISYLVGIAFVCSKFAFDWWPEPISISSLGSNWDHTLNFERDFDLLRCISLRLFEWMETSTLLQIPLMHIFSPQLTFMLGELLANVDIGLMILSEIWQLGSFLIKNSRFYFISALMLCLTNIQLKNKKLITFAFPS